MVRRRERRKGTYHRVGEGLAVNDEGRNSSARVDLQVLWVKVLALIVSRYSA